MLGGARRQNRLVQGLLREAEVMCGEGIGVGLVLTP